MSLGSSNATKSKTETGLEASSSVSKTPFVAAGLLLAVLLAVGILPRLKRHSELAASAQQQENAVPVVEVIKPKPAEASNELVLPATTQAIQEIIVSARTSGYVRRWLIGIGQPVKAGI